jgi:hypothetical protein
MDWMGMADCGEAHREARALKKETKIFLKKGLTNLPDYAIIYESQNDMRC